MIVTLEKEFRDGKDVLHLDVRNEIAFRAQGRRRQNPKGRMVVSQNIRETNQFLLWMEEHKIRKYIEVGTSFGGMLCLVDQFLRACFDDVETYGVDIIDRMIDYEEYHQKYPKCKFEKVNEYWLPEDCFDLIYIDNNLRGRDMFDCANCLRPFSEYIAFHDVEVHKYGSRDFWYGGEADRWGKEAYWHDGGLCPGVGIVRC